METPRKQAAEPQASEESPLQRGLHFLSVISLCVALAAFLFNVWAVRSMPSLSADSLIYHLTIPAYWTQQGFLHTVDLPFHDGAAEHSPLITETIIYALMKVTGNDDLAWLVQPAFFLLVVLLFHGSARQIGVDVLTARFLAAFLLLFPPFFHSALIVNSELVMTCGVAAFVYGMLLTRTGCEAGFYVAATGIALTFASKTIGVIYGSIGLVIFVIWFIAATREKPSATSPVGPRFQWRRTGILCAVFLLLGLTFHFRNLWLFGNPLYPARLTIAGIPILPGRFDASVFANHGWSPTAFAKMLFFDTESFAMNRQFGVMLWLAMLVPLGHLVFRRLGRADLLPAALFVIYPLLSIILYFAVTPFWAEHRLLFPVYYLLWGNLAWSLHLLARSGPPLLVKALPAVVGLAFVAYAMFFLFYDEVPLLLLVAAGVAGLAIANYPWLWEVSMRARWIAAALALAAAVGSGPWWYPALARERAAIRTACYPRFYKEQGEAWNRLAELTAASPATIAYSGNALIYPLFGPKLANRVVYVPVHPQDQPGPTELTRAQSIYLQLARQRRAQVDEPYWLTQLREKEVDFLLLVDDPALGGVQAERSIAAHYPSLLQPIFQQGNVALYAVHR